MAKKNDKLRDNSKNASPRQSIPPVVAVLGHVDHGKTSLLDAIRKTNIANREHGGITQAIGASSVEIVVEGEKKRITFIDTPGHEAFSQMRGRGTQVSDVGLLVISSVDGVMPQTKESIKLLKESNTPFIVVLTKADDPQKNEEKVKQQLLKEEVLLEGYGGDVPYLSVSARANTNIKELLELIILVFEMRKDKSASKDTDFKAIVIESRLDQKSGPRATIVVKNGKLSIRDEIVCDGIRGRARTIMNDLGNHLENANVGDAVEILGFEKVLPIGAVVAKKMDEVLVKPSKEEKKSPPPPASSDAPAPLGFLPEEEEAPLSLILSADNLGSLEAIVKSLPERINIVHQKTGDISPSDILHAKSTGAIVLGFNIKIKPELQKFATQEKILLKNYRIIYELIDEIKEVLKGKELALQEEIYGKAKILASFPFEKTKAYGVKVLEGRIARGDKIRIIGKDDIIGEGTITSVRIGKNVTSKVEEGGEAGVIITPSLDITIGDMIICHG